MTKMTNQQSTKKSFLLYNDTYPAIKDLSDKDKACLLDAIFNYSNGEDIGDLPTGAKISFGFIKQSLDRDTEKYLGICEKNRNNANKRWKNEVKTIPKDTTAYDRIRMDTKHTHSDSGTDNDSNKLASKSYYENFLSRMGSRGKVENGIAFYLNGSKQWEQVKNLEKFMAKIESDAPNTSLPPPKVGSPEMWNLLNEASAKETARRSK
jgi:hypothetical protein